MIQSKPSEKGEIITYLSRMGDVLKYIADSGKLVFSACTVNTVIDGDKVYAKLREKNIRIHTHLQIVAPESAHICLCNQKTKKIYRFREKIPGCKPGISRLQSRLIYACQIAFSEVLELPAYFIRAVRVDINSFHKSVCHLIGQARLVKEPIKL